MAWISGNALLARCVSKILVRQLLKFLIQINCAILVLAGRIMQNNSILPSLSDPSGSTNELAILQERTWQHGNYKRVPAISFDIGGGLKVQASSLVLID